MVSDGALQIAPLPITKLNSGNHVASTPLYAAGKEQGGKRSISPKKRARMEENRKKALRLQAERRAQAHPQRSGSCLSTGKGQPVVIDVTALNRAEQLLK